ncbi:TetR/AcrR family transcriptional regulator [Microbacterium sp. KR10-403]|uniref:TetR/AcrR family transcriptional regulator n=1 Tax=Microbacterium sp. KR10-403 TaxID=3158581 RepID=UPI0032E507DE
MTDHEVRRRTGGRSERVRRAVIEAALQLLRDEGVEEFTVAKVAATAGVNATSVYRRWTSRENLILDAIVSEGEKQGGSPDTGTLAGDLTAYAEALGDYLATADGTALTRVLFSPDVLRELQPQREELIGERVRDLTRMLDRARERGEITGHPDPRAILDILISPQQIRVIAGESPDKCLPTRLARVATAGIDADAFDRPAST